MQYVGFVVIAVALSARLLAFVLRRHAPDRSASLRLVASGVVYLGAAAVLGWASVGVIELGGVWLALAALLALMALVVLALGFLFLWAALPNSRLPGRATREL
jgi:hypothetical protein